MCSLVLLLPNKYTPFYPLLSVPCSLSFLPFSSAPIIPPKLFPPCTPYCFNLVYFLPFDTYTTKHSLGILNSEQYLSHFLSAWAQVSFTQGSITLINQAKVGVACLFACIDRFKSRVITFHLSCLDANVFFRVCIS